MTTINSLLAGYVSQQAIEILYSGGSVISGSSPIFSGSAGNVGVSQVAIEILTQVPVRSYVSQVALELLVNLNGTYESVPPTPATEQTLTYSFVT